VKGDLEDADGLRRAMEGVEGVFSVQTPYAAGGVERETREGIAVADAAKAVGVPYLVYSSVGGAERQTGIPHFESKFRVEEHIRASGLHAAILRPTFFMENFAGPAGPQEVNGELVLRMALSPDRRLQMIACRDIGAFAALAFAGQDGVAGRELEIAGDELSPVEIAAAFSEAAGRPVRFERLPLEALATKSAENATMFGWFEASGYRADIPTLRRVHPELATFRAWTAGLSARASSARPATNAPGS
jgi:uncharacterized protein YbjT (DUF2867 family)